jgi:hypothetical protein
MTRTAPLLCAFALAWAVGCGPSSGGAGTDGATTSDAGATMADSAAAAGGCAAIAEVMPTVCSMAGAARNAVFTNNCPVPVEIWWVTFQCGEQFYQRLAPGQSYTQPSFVTHPWRARTVVPGVPMGTMKGMLIKEFGAIPPGADSQAFAVP